MVKRKRHVMKSYNPAEDNHQSWPRKNKLLVELRKQKLSGMLCDVVFVYEDFKLYSHACVLASFSPYMMKLLLLDHDSVFPECDNWCFKTPLKINLTDIFRQKNHICWKCFTNIIDFMYTSKIYMYNCHLNHIEYAATVLQISELIIVCVKFKQSECKKSKFNVDKHFENAAHNTIQNKIHHGLKLFPSKFSNQSEVANSRNISDSLLHRNCTNENVETSEICNIECQNSKKLKTSTFKSVQKSNKKTHEVEIKEHEQVSESVCRIASPKNSNTLSNVISEEKVKELKTISVSPNETDKINLNGNIAEQSSFKTHSNNIKNTVTKQKFSTSTTLTKNVNSQTQILKYGNKEDKIAAEKNRCNTSVQSTDKQSVESGHCKDDNISKIKEEVPINIAFSINKGKRSTNEDETYNNYDNVPKKDSVLNVENIHRNQLTDLTVNGLHESPTKNRDEENELSSKQIANNKNVLLTNVTKSSESSIHQVTESVNKIHHNEVSESSIIFRNRNNESGLNVSENEKESKMNIQAEHSSLKTKEKTKFCCEICQYKTLRLSKIVDHLEINDHGQTSCCICMYEFSDNMEFKQHLKLHKENIPFQCLTCDKKFKSINYFKNHLYSHSSKKTFVCSICNASFKHSYNLSRHRINEHTGTPDEKYSCEHCRFTTSVKHKLILHLQEHGFTIPVFTCSVSNCKFQTTREISLTKHEKTHFETESFFCETCGSKFSHVKNLKRHIREKHSPGLLKLKCSKCDYTTNRKHSLNIHMTSHSRKDEKKPKAKSRNGHAKRKCVDKTKKPYKCEFCEERFVNKGNVRRHNIAMHHANVIKLDCNTCTYKTTRDDLYRHHTSKHNATQNIRKLRRIACKPSSPIVCIVKTVNTKKNRLILPKCNLEERNVLDNKTSVNISRNNSKVGNNYSLNPLISSTEETVLHCEGTLSVTNDHNNVYVCEICGNTVVSEENLQIHKSEHNAQHTTVGQMVRDDCCLKNKISPEAKTLDRSNQTGSYINVLIPVNESEVTNLTNNITANLENETCVALNQYNSGKQNVLSVDQERSDNVVDMNFSLPLDAVNKVGDDSANKKIIEFCTQKVCTDKEQPNSANEESTHSTIEPSTEQIENSSLSNFKTSELNEEIGKLSVTDASGTIKHLEQNHSDKTDIHYNVSSSCNATETSVSNFCNTLNSGSCNITRNSLNNIEHINIEHSQLSTELNSSDVFSLHGVTDLNRTYILNETTGEINIIIDNNSNITNNAENASMWQNTNSDTWILDESTGTLTNVSICKKQTDESLGSNDRRDVISFSNKNTTVILNEGTGELTFISLNSDALEKNENNDVFGNSNCFDDDTQSNFSVDSQEDFTFDNISLPSPVASNERNSVTEFLNELTGEINFCSFTSNDNSNVNNTDYVNSNFKEKNNDGMVWNSQNDEDEDLTFLNELTGEILQSTSKINNRHRMISDSNRIENESLPVFEAKNNTDGGESTKESADSVYLNEETGIISWNTLNQVTSDSNMLDKNADWFFGNLQNDSLDSFTTDDDNFSKQFQYNLFLNSPCDNLTLDVGSSGILLNESTGELVTKISSESHHQ